MKCHLEQNNQILVSCPLAKASQIIGDIWMILIVNELLSGNNKFGEIHEKISEIHLPNKMSTKTLSDRLKFLVDQKLVDRIVETSSPIAVDYKLTKKGRALEGVIQELRKYGVENFGGS